MKRGSRAPASTASSASPGSSSSRRGEPNGQIQTQWKVVSTSSQCGHFARPGTISGEAGQLSGSIP
eukprot:5495677-Pyramimonas_sp.AAC.1